MKQSIHDSVESTKDSSVIDCHDSAIAESRNDAPLSSLQGQRPKQSIKDSIKSSDSAESSEKMDLQVWASCERNARHEANASRNDEQRADSHKSQGDSYNDDSNATPHKTPESRNNTSADSPKPSKAKRLFNAIFTPYNELDSKDYKTYRDISIFAIINICFLICVFSPFALYSSDVTQFDSSQSLATLSALVGFFLLSSFLAIYLTSFFYKTRLLKIGVYGFSVALLIGLIYSFILDFNVITGESYSEIDNFIFKNPHSIYSKECKFVDLAVGILSCVAVLGLFRFALRATLAGLKIAFIAFFVVSGVNLYSITKDISTLEAKTANSPSINSPLGETFRPFENFEHSQTHSLASRPKFSKEAKASTADTRIFSNANGGESVGDSADSMESNKINPHEVPPNLAPLRGSEIEEQGGRSASALLELECDIARLSPKSETATAVWRVGERGGGAALFAKKSDYANETNLTKSRRRERVENAESLNKSNNSIELNHNMDCHDSATQNLAMTAKGDSAESSKSNSVDSHEALTSHNDEKGTPFYASIDSHAFSKSNSRNDERRADSTDFIESSSNPPKIDYTNLLPPYHNALTAFSKDDINVLVLLFDGFSGSHLGHILEQFPQFREHLGGFTYYPNTISVDGHTTRTAHTILSGHAQAPYANKNKSMQEYADGIKDALLRTYSAFAKGGFDVQSFGMPYLQNADSSKGVSIYDYSDDYFPAYKALHNIESLVQSLRVQNRPIGEMISMGLFYFAPYTLRTRVYRDFEFGSHSWIFGSKVQIGGFINGLKNASQLPIIARNLNANAKGKTLKYIHTMHTHYPFSLDSTSSCVPRFSPPSQLPEAYKPFVANALHYDNEICAMREAFVILDFLKANGIYDNTMIVLVSDHSYNDIIEHNIPKSSLGNNPNPLLLIKNFNAKAPLQVDSRLMSNADVYGILCDTFKVCDEPNILKNYQQNREIIHTLNVHWTQEAKRKDSLIFEKIWKVSDVLNPQKWQEVRE